MDLMGLYRRKAEELERLAAQTADPVEDAGFRLIAAFWRGLEAEAAPMTVGRLDPASADRSRHRNLRMS